VVSLLFEVFMAKHTPGPWKIFEGWGADKRRPVIVDAIPDVDGKFVGNCICHMASTNPDIEANARMIAAAPDLLRLLKESVSTLAASRRPIEDWLNESRTLIQKIESEK
jgi:hypothetical protein